MLNCSGTVASMTPAVLSIAIPPRSGSAMGVEIHQAGECLAAHVSGGSCLAYLAGRLRYKLCIILFLLHTLD